MLKNYTEMGGYFLLQSCDQVIDYCMAVSLCNQPDKRPDCSSESPNTLLRDKLDTKNKKGTNARGMLKKTKTLQIIIHTQTSHSEMMTEYSLPPAKHIKKVSRTKVYNLLIN